MGYSRALVGRIVDVMIGRIDDAAPSAASRQAEAQEQGFAYLRLGAAGRNRWDRRDLVRGIGSDSGVGEPSPAVWPGLRPGLSGR